MANTPFPLAVLTLAQTVIARGQRPSPLLCLYGSWGLTPGHLLDRASTSYVPFTG